MLPAEEYQRIWRTHGRKAADEAFNRSMRKENLKLVGAAVVLVLLLIATWYVS